MVGRDRRAAYAVVVASLVLVVEWAPTASGQNPASDAVATFRASLTSAERTWLSRHPEIRVAFDGHFPPYSVKTTGGTLEGYAVDIFGLLEKRLGVRFVRSRETTWKGLYTAAQHRKTDVVATMVARPERRQWFVFTKPYIFKSLVIMRRKGDDRIRSKANLGGKTLAVVKDYQYVGPLFAAHPTAVPQQHDSMLEALNAVSTGKADAAITFFAAGNYIRDKFMLSNLEFIAIYDRDSSLESIAIRKDWPLLRSILDKALASLTPDERRVLDRKWMPASPPPKPAERLQLTEAEQNWIKEHPTIRLGVDPEFRPFEFIGESGQHRGIAADYVRLLNDRLGINMEVVPNLTWAEAVARAKRREIDVLPCVGTTPERRRHFDYTAPYLDFQRVIIARTDAPFMTGAEDLAAMTVGVQASSSHEGYLATIKTEETRPYPTLRKAILAVSRGETDVMVGNIASATYWIRKLNVTNLKVAAAVSDTSDTLHFAVRKDWPVLTGILQKGLASISHTERKAIARRWVVVRHDPKVQRRIPLTLILGLAGVVIVVLLWNMQIRRGRRRLAAAKEAAERAEAEARKANAELAQLRDDLEDMVKRRTAELIESEQKFQHAQKMEALGTLVGGIAHDFNNILAGMLGAIFLAQAKKSDPQAVHAKLDSASTLGFRGAELIKQLLTYARKDVATDRGFVRLSKLIDDARGVLRAGVPALIEVEIVDESANAGVHGNAALLEQVVLNLVNNARDALADTAEPRIELRVYRFDTTDAFALAHPNLGDKPLACIEVRDNGSGIDEAVIDRVFDPFFSTKAPGQGTGLGLSMVAGAVRDHGGVIEATSRPGSGSTFSVYLPIVDPEDVEESAEPAQVMRGAGQTILIADDEAEVLAAHREILEDLGYTVRAVSDGKQAVEAVAAAPEDFDLVILDVLMPQLDGIAAARRIRTLRAGLPIMFLTAYDFSRDLPDRLRDASEAVLAKPCSVATLSRAIHTRLAAAGK